MIAERYLQHDFVLPRVLERIVGHMGGITVAFRPIPQHLEQSETDLLLDSVLIGRVVGDRV